MRGVVLLLRAHVDHDHLAAPGLRQQLLAPDAGHAGGIGHHLLQRHAQFDQVLFGHLAQRHAELGDIAAAEPVDHALAFAPHLHQPRLLQRLQMGAGELDVDAHVGGNRFDRLLPLRQHLQHLQPLRAGQCLAHAGDLFVQKILERFGCPWCTF